jgi:hypothetical protein
LADLETAAQSQAPWLWQGYLARGSVTMLTSQWKSGKTTLVAVLLSKLKSGGELAGLPLNPGKAAIISEESAMHWYRRSQRLAFSDHICWYCRPFKGKPRPEEWQALVDHLLQLRAEQGLDLVVIDTLASFLPSRNENAAGSMLEALMPLQVLTGAGMTVLILHHPRKGSSAAGQAARGSGALSGFVDILIEMEWYGPPQGGDRRRRLQAYSRFEETPRTQVIELSEDGGDYRSHGGFDEDEFVQGWDQLRALLEKAPGKLSRREILEQWPFDWHKPEETTLWRWLERGRTQGKILQDGAGTRTDPYRYWLPGKEEEWKLDPLYELQELMRSGLTR